MADDLDLEQVAALRKKRQFKKLTFRGLELEQLLDLNQTELLNFVNARARRMKRDTSTGPKYMALIKKIKEAQGADLWTAPSQSRRILEMPDCP